MMGAMQCGLLRAHCHQALSSLCRVFCLLAYAAYPYGVHLHMYSTGLDYNLSTAT